jgi:O-antigen ligase
MIIPLALGYFLTEMPLSKRLIYGFFLGIMNLALFLSLSRAGVLIYIAVLVFIISLSRLKDNFKSKTKTLCLWAFLILSSLIFIAESKAIINRLSTLFHKNAFVVFGHGYSWLDILGIWRDFPLFGTGLGTFGNISSMYKTNPAQSLFIYAHNDCLQLLSEVGLLGFISVSLFFVLYFNSVLRMWLRRHDSYTVCLALGGMASVLGMLLYSLLDFNLHIPANAMLFFLIMGLVYRLLYTRFNHGSSLSK